MKDTYTLVTDRIIAELESGTIPWHKPWTCTQPAISHTTGKAYSLLNQLLLGGRSGEYLTFQQAQKEGGRVKKGEKASMVVFWKWLKVEDEDTGEEKDVPFLRYFNVFHVDQCEGISPRFRASEALPVDPAEVNDAAEDIVADYLHRSGVHLVSRESSEAFYRPATDTVVLPLIKQFADTAEYYSTAFHELTHSTGHPSRLNRLTETARFGSAPYSREELCAELGASFILNHLGLETPASFRNNAAYIEHWLSVLKEDKRLLVSAAGQADKAVRLILNDKEDGDDVHEG
ncbi:MAG: DUF1738 domain-containing protein [Clostridia bacterium]|nr:DUF1738 domain-containing protein [Clostridia bacterium]